MTPPDLADAPEATPEEIAAEHQARVDARWSPRPSIPAPGQLGASLGVALAAVRAHVASPEHAEAVALDRARQERIARRAVQTLARDRGLPHAEALRAIATDPDPAMTPALEAVHEIARWRRGRRVGCVRLLAGPPGTGKSCAAAWACLWDEPRLPREVSALFVAAAEMGRVPRNAYSEHIALWQRWTEVPLLVVDDLGLEGEGAREGMALLLLERFQGARVTICTANLTDRAFGARYLTGEIGPRLADRLVREQGHLGHPSGLPWYVGVEGESLRGGGAR